MSERAEWVRRLGITVVSRGSCKRAAAYPVQKSWPCTLRSKASLLSGLPVFLGLLRVLTLPLYAAAVPILSLQRLAAPVPIRQRRCRGTLHQGHSTWGWFTTEEAGIQVH